MEIEISKNAIIAVMTIGFICIIIGGKILISGLIDEINNIDGSE